MKETTRGPDEEVADGRERGTVGTVAWVLCYKYSTGFRETFDSSARYLHELTSNEPPWNT